MPDRSNKRLETNVTIAKRYGFFSHLVNLEITPFFETTPFRPVSGLRLQPSSSPLVGLLCSSQAAERECLKEWSPESTVSCVPGLGQPLFTNCREEVFSETQE